MLTKWEQVQMEMEELKAELERLNRRLDLYENIYDDLIPVFEKEEPSDYMHGYISAMKNMKKAFIRLFERDKDGEQNG